MFGAVGEGGAFIVAKNGLNWSSREIDTTNDLTGLVYANGNFLTVGTSGTIRSGIVWLLRDSGTDQPLSGIAYGQGRFVAVGSQSAPSHTNLIISSSNGRDWITDRIGTEGSLIGITYGDSGGFVAVSNDGAVLNSKSGTSWTSKNLSPGNSLRGVAYGNGLYITVTYTIGPQLSVQAFAFRSTSGLDWTGPTLIAGMSGPDGIAFGNNRFVSVSFAASGVSSNGVDWMTAPLNVNTYRIVFGNGQFIVSAQGGALSSPDGITWTPIDLGAPALGYGDLGFVAQGFVVPPYITMLFTSSDGISWKSRALEGDPQWQSIAFASGTYVAVGDGGLIRQSTPLHPQVQPTLGGQTSSLGFALSALAPLEGTYHIQVSTNLFTWVDQFPVPGGQWSGPFIDTAATNRSSSFYRLHTP
jgi:hypothetical protein